MSTTPDSAETRADDHEPRIVFGGSTDNGRSAVVELYDQDGETLIVTKGFQPLPPGFSDDFEGNEGTVPGGSWKVMPNKDGEPAALFKTQAYSRQYAALLIAGFTAALGEQGLREVGELVTIHDWDRETEAVVDRKLTEMLNPPAAPDASTEQLRDACQAARRYIAVFEDNVRDEHNAAILATLDAALASSRPSPPTS